MRVLLRGLFYLLKDPRTKQFNYLLLRHQSRHQPLQ